MHTKFDKEGNNLLHNLILFGTLEEIAAFLTPITRELNRLSLSVNNHGYLPYELVSERLNTSGEKLKKIRELLFPVMNSQQIKPLHELVDIKDICHNFSITPDDPVFEYLKDGCTAVNIVRSKIRYSSSHLNCDFDLLIDPNDSKQKHLIDQIESSNNEINKYYKNFFKNKEKDSHFSVVTDHKKYLAIIYQIAEETRKELFEVNLKMMDSHQFGNCEDMAFYALYHFNEIQLKKPKEKRLEAEIFNCLNGDHAFIIAGRNLRGNPSDFTTWKGNKPLLLIDPWSGSVFPVTPKTLSENLLVYRTLIIGFKKFKALIPFNPFYHKLQLNFWCIYKNHLHIIYVPKNNKREWLRFREDCSKKDETNGQTLLKSGESIIKKHEYENRHSWPESTILFHYPLDKTEHSISKKALKFSSIFRESQANSPFFRGLSIDENDIIWSKKNRWQYERFHYNCSEIIVSIFSLGFYVLLKELAEDTQDYNEDINWGKICLVTLLFLATGGIAGILAGIAVTVRQIGLCESYEDNSRVLTLGLT